MSKKYLRLKVGAGLVCLPIPLKTVGGPLSVMLKVLELARQRRTVRRFKDAPVSPETVMPAIEAACEAPSGANYQGWKFSVIVDPKTKRRIRSASEDGEKRFYMNVSGKWKQWLGEASIDHRKPFLEEAPLLVVVYALNDAPYSKESVWLAVGYMLLALEEMGLSTVTYTPSYPRQVEQVIEVPEGYRLEAILPIGYTDDPKPKEPRKNHKELVKTFM